MTDQNNKISAASDDGVDRRGFLKCMAWAGTGLVWTLGSGAMPFTSRVFGSSANGALQQSPIARAPFSFVQISDSHIGFTKEPNKDVIGTLKLAVDRINAMKETPAFMIHTGDLTHLATPDEFDAVQQILKSCKVKQIFYVPGEHDVFTDNGKTYLDRFGAGTQGGGWHSFDHSGAHFVGLVNVMNLKAGNMGVLGDEQIAWLKRDLEGVADSTPIIAFAHVPLWSVYPKWGWGTEDSERVLALLKRFSAVTILNGHIHQIMQKVEGNVTFHTARSTAFPQPEPGKAESPGPMKNVPADRLRKMLGLTSVNITPTNSHLAIVDSTLE